jgi:hypothetical protein
MPPNNSFKPTGYAGRLNSGVGPQMEGQPPIAEAPAVRADLNAQGWAGSGDNAFYVLDPVALALAQPEPEKRIFLWDHDESGTVLGWVAILEHVTVGQFTDWRAIPVPGSFYRGPTPAFVPSGLGA